jgi:hypothetical protein
MLARCHHSSRAALARDFDLARTTINSATVDGDARVRSWAYWTRFCLETNVDPWMRKLPRLQSQAYLLAFGERIRRGYFRPNGRQVQYGSVEAAVRHVCQAHVLAGQPDTRRAPGAAHLDLPFQRQKLAMTAADPPRRPQLALPVSTLELAATTLTGLNTAKADATSDLITVAFYFLLRVGEYTFPRKNTTTRTVQFRRKDIRLWRHGCLLSHELPLQMLLLADSATMYIENQKNGNKGDTLHHTAVHGPFCPVKALARRVFANRQLAPADPDTPLSLYGPGGQHVLSADIDKALKKAAHDDSLPLRGYDLSRIGPHSLRASGAMACTLNGIDITILQKLGRWTSTTFMMYIHAQIAALTNGVAQRMATRLTFTNVGG